MSGVVLKILINIFIYPIKKMNRNMALLYNAIDEPEVVPRYFPIALENMHES